MLNSAVLNFQNSLVVCRLRKNSEFNLNNTSNRASQHRRVHNSNCAVSEGCPDQTGEGDKAVESSSKMCSSSHDSYSTEQTDSASEAEQKLLDDVNPAESSSHQKVGLHEFFVVHNCLIQDRRCDPPCYRSRFAFCILVIVSIIIQIKLICLQHALIRFSSCLGFKFK